MHRKKLFNYISQIALIIAGILCIIRTPYITKWFPYLIGSIMVFAGVTMFIDTFPIMKKGFDREKNSSRVTRSMLLVMLGVATIFMKEEAMPFIGVTWGLLGLLKGVRGITVVLNNSLKDRTIRFVFIQAIIGIILSFILLFNPVDAVGKHIIILGCQIIIYAVFKIDANTKPKNIMDELHEQVDRISRPTQ